MNKPITQTQIKELRQLLADGLTCSQVAAKMNRSCSNVYKYSSDENYQKSLESVRNKTPEQKARQIESQNKYLASDKGKAKNKRYWSSDKGKKNSADWKRTTEAGRAKRNEDAALRRQLKTNTPDVVLLDGVWYEVDRKLTYSACKSYLLSSEERKAIKAIYLKAQRLTEQTNIEHHVDHIQPLTKGGEHAAFNLQILTSDENLSKHNDFRDKDKALLAQRLFN